MDSHGTVRNALILGLAVAGWLPAAARATEPVPAKGAAVSRASEWPRSATDAQARIEALRAQIAHHDRLYFQHGVSEISDEAYDGLRRELAELEARFPASRGPSSAAPLGDDRTGLFPTRRHRVRMTSLAKTYEEADLRMFIAGLERRLGRGNLDYVVEPKVDGLGISAIYEKGRLVHLVTRGNGAEGDDLMRNAAVVRNLPLRLRGAGGADAASVPDFVELRGELHFTFAEFERINRERVAADETTFSNPRNLAAGTARSLDSRETAGRNLSVVFFGWGAWEPGASEPASQQDFYRQARAWGVPVIESWWSGRGADGVCAAVRTLGAARRRLGFPTDGAVVKLDPVALRDAAGGTDYAPGWAMAFKYRPARVETRLREITVQVGRTGRLTPVAELDPVRLGNRMVARATLHNREAIARLDLRPGDIVVVELAGEVIPEITGIDRTRRPAGSRPYVFPDHCPACGTAVVPLDEEAAGRCPNPGCPAQVTLRVRYFASRACLGIDGLGPVTISRLVAQGKVKDVADLYRLRAADLARDGRKPGKSAGRVIAAIQRSKHAELWRFILGLSIPRIGAARARQLAQHFGSLPALAAAGRGNFEAGQPGRGAGIDAMAADAVVSFFEDPRNRALVDDLVKLGVTPAAPPD